MFPTFSDLEKHIVNKKNKNMLLLIGDNYQDAVFIEKLHGQICIKIKKFNARDYSIIAFYNSLNDALDSQEPLGFKLFQSIIMNVPLEIINL